MNVGDFLAILDPRGLSGRLLRGGGVLRLANVKSGHVLNLLDVNRPHSTVFKRQFDSIGGESNFLRGGSDRGDDESRTLLCCSPFQGH